MSVEETISEEETIFEEEVEAEVSAPEIVHLTAALLHPAQRSAVDTVEVSDHFADLAEVLEETSEEISDEAEDSTERELLRSKVLAGIVGERDTTKDNAGVPPTHARLRVSGRCASRKTEKPDSRG